MSNRGGSSLVSLARRAMWAVVCMAAVVITGRDADAVPLSTLLAGGFLDAGSSRFRDWQLVSLDTTSLPAPDLALISVNALVNDAANPGLQFVGNNQLAVAGINAIDLMLKYRVERLAGGKTYTGETLAITGLTFGAAGGIALVSGEFASGGGVPLASTAAIANNGNNVFQFTGTTAMFPQASLQVTTNVFLNGTAGNDAINFTSFTQRFAQTGPLGVPGDYNQNGTIDAADYTVWRNNVGAPAGTLPNDTVGGVIGSGQYNLWKGNFGLAGSGAAAGATAVNVPEPISALLVWMAAISYSPRRSRRRNAVTPEVV